MGAISVSKGKLKQNQSVYNNLIARFLHVHASKMRDFWGNFGHVSKLWGNFGHLRKTVG